MLVLGCDLSYACSGLVWVRNEPLRVISHLKITVKPGPLRLLRAGRAFHGALVGLKPDLAVIEDVAVGCPNRFVLCKLVALSAICEMVLEAHRVPYLKASPTLLKKWVAGKGTAEKHVVAQELERRWGIKFENDKGHDLSDAAACAAWGAKR